jgi:hypothetical protein
MEKKMFEYPKWVYFTDGPQESYAPDMAPVLVQSQDEEDALLADRLESADAPDDDAPVVRRGRPSKAAQ